MLRHTAAANGDHAPAADPNVKQVLATGLTIRVDTTWAQPGGVLVATVRAGSGAAQAGLKPAADQVTVEGESWPAGGDVIVNVDGEPIDSVDRLVDVISAKKPGDKIDVEVVRGGSHKTLTVKLGRQP